jgi:hypothetical protein
MRWHGTLSSQGVCLAGIKIGAELGVIIYMLSAKP